MQVISAGNHSLLVYKKDIRLIYRDILNELYVCHQGLQAYTLYTRRSIEPEDILSFIEKYDKLGYISVAGKNGSRIKLTEKGRNDCGAEIQRLSKDAGFKSENYLSSILISPINVYSPYVPMKAVYEEDNEDVIPF